MVSKCTLLAIALVFTGNIYAQNVAINADGSIANSNAMLDIKSPNKGLLIPRMSTSARLQIPATQGLIVYDTETNSFWYNTGRQWLNVSTVNAATYGASGWSFFGNAGTIDGENFIGTIDDVPLNFRVNNQRAGRIDHRLGNSFWGYRAGNSITTGNDNTAVGASALFALTTGYNNTGVGSNALMSTSTGFHNAAFGRFALMFNDDGSNNTALGTGAMSFNRSGSWNTATGAEALRTNITGVLNVATGFQALYNNMSGSNNTAVGYHALFSNTSISGQTAVGYRALLFNTEGFRNTATGFEALRDNINGRDNTAMGNATLAGNIAGYLNTGVGTFALSSNSDGWGNVAVGSDALLSNSQGLWNTAVGGGTLLMNTVSPFNTAIGTSALVNNEGASNTAVGVQSLSLNTIGNNNTAIGYLANVVTGDLNNATAIGSGAVVDASNKVRIGNAAISVIEGQVPMTIPSDSRYKSQVQEDVKGLDFIMQLRPVTFRFDARAFDSRLNDQQNTVAKSSTGNQWQLPSSSKTMEAAYDAASGIRRSGFIAQEVEQAAKKTGYNFSGVVSPNNEQHYYSLSYDAFVVPLVKAIQEQQTIIVDQRKAIAEHIKKNTEQDKKMVELQQQLDELKNIVKKLQASN